MSPQPPDPYAESVPLPADPTLYDLDRAALGSLLDGEPKFRLDQLWSGLYEQLKDPADISNLPKPLRSAIADLLPSGLTLVRKSESRDRDTVKYLWQLRDGHLVETVVMHYDTRTTVCISSQAGCAMACGFCATGQAGFDRNLSAGEIIEQVVRAAQQSARRIDNVVFMGMGEPLANFDPVAESIQRLHDDVGIGARHLTVSTVGIIPGIRKFADLNTQVGLAVSLHAANDRKRNELVPVNRRYPLGELARVCHEYIQRSGRRLSFEWAMIDGVNDTPTDADELAAFANPLRAHVNLIPLNPTPGYPTVGSPIGRVHQFSERLQTLGVNATVRRNRGTDIDAACGQLKSSHARAVRGAAKAVNVAAPRRSR